MFDIDKLKQPEVQKKFKIELRNRSRVLENLQDSDTDKVENLERKWNDIKKIFTKTPLITYLVTGNEREKNG